MLLKTDADTSVANLKERAIGLPQRRFGRPKVRPRCCAVLLDEHRTISWLICRAFAAAVSSPFAAPSLPLNDTFRAGIVAGLPSPPAPIIGQSKTRCRVCSG